MGKVTPIKAYLACCSYHHVCTHGFSHRGHNTPGVKYIQCVYNSECLNQDGVCVLCVMCVCVWWGKGGRDASAGLSSRLSGLVCNVQEVLTQCCWQTHKHTHGCVRGVCILKGDYVDKNRRVFSTDLESDWCNKETMEGGRARVYVHVHIHTHTRCVR